MKKKWKEIKSSRKERGSWSENFKTQYNVRGENYGIGDRHKNYTQTQKKKGKEIES